MKAFAFSRGKPAAFAAVFVACLAVHSEQQTSMPTPGSDDPISPVREAYAKILSVLPRSGKIGYLGSADNRRYFHAQYCLAPLVVVRGDRFDFVIVEDKFASRLSDFELIAKTGHGTSVYRRKAQ
jgi:hypothetical protein